MRRTVVLTLAALAAGAVIAVGSAQAAPAAKTFRGTVGPGFTIKLNKKQVKRGKYTIVVRDRSSSHNFHIRGRGVNKRTSVSKTGTFRLKVTLKKGRYTIVCDPHASSMRTTLRVT